MPGFFPGSPPCLRAVPAHRSRPMALPLFLSAISAGFPSPADDFQERQLDLNEEYIRHPAATFFVRAVGDSMIGAGIHSGDLLIVDRALEAQDGAVVVAVLDGEFTVKRLTRQGRKLLLAPANAAYRPLEITAETDFVVWGVVTGVIHRFKT